jgi:hypothetical protein
MEDRPGHEWEFNGISELPSKAHGKRRNTTVMTRRHNWRCSKCGAVTSTEGPDRPDRNWTSGIRELANGEYSRAFSCEELQVALVQES